MAEAAIFLGVDGGGSKTEALAVDESGRVLGSGRSGGSNHQVAGLDTAVRHIHDAVQQALAGRRADVAAFCLSGADMRPDFARLEPALRALDAAAQFTIHNDVIGVFRAGSEQPYGVGVVCGSGFNAGGISRDGREVRFPSLGSVTGDRAGGGHLGTAAIGAAFRAWDGRGLETLLRAEVLRALGAPDFDTLAEWLLQDRVTMADVIQLAPLVFAAAVRGDALAQEFIREQGREIGISILAILRRLDLLDTPCRASLGGRVFYGEGPLLLDTIAQTVHPAAPRVELKRLDTQPVVGAVLLALDHAGIPTGDPLMQRLKHHLPEALRAGSSGAAES